MNDYYSSFQCRKRDLVREARRKAIKQFGLTLRRLLNLNFQNETIWAIIKTCIIKLELLAGFIDANVPVKNGAQCPKTEVECQTRREDRGAERGVVWGGVSPLCCEGLGKELCPQKSLIFHMEMGPILVDSGVL